MMRIHIIHISHLSDRRSTTNFLPIIPHNLVNSLHFTLPSHLEIPNACAFLDVEGGSGNPTNSFGSHTSHPNACTPRSSRIDRRSLAKYPFGARGSAAPGRRRRARRCGSVGSRRLGCRRGRRWRDSRQRVAKRHRGGEDC